MKKIITFLILAVLSISLSAQEGSLGIFGGAAYYNGELNPRGVLYMPSLGIGVLYRHSFDERWTLRIGVNYATLRGDDAVSTNSYQLERNHSFSTQVFDIGPQMELNFFKYDPDKFERYYFTPYITTGILVAVIPDSYTNFQIGVPIGFGIKYALTTQITAGLEWTYRWTNSDDIDDLLPDNFTTFPSNQLSYNPDTDWYSFMGAFITIRVFKEKSTCPAFMF